MAITVFFYKKYYYFYIIAIQYKRKIFRQTIKVMTLIYYDKILLKKKIKKLI